MSFQRNTGTPTHSCDIQKLICKIKKKKRVPESTLNKVSNKLF